MNYFTLYSIIFVCVGQAFAEVLDDENLDKFESLPEKKQRQFSLFSVVTFKNSECTAKAAGIAGVCFTSTECSAKGGTSDGNCAASFGVCCLLKVNACSGTVSENCTYIENAEYPSTSAVVSSCTYTINKCATDICQIRLDYTATTLVQPTSASGSCSTDSLIALGTAESSTLAHKNPTVCGTLTGDHMYLDAGRASGAAATIAITVAGTGTSSWRIKVTQIQCWAAWRAPAGCQQYFTGRSNTVTSFNFAGTSCASSSVGCFIYNQKYTVCFRPEEGMCGVAYSQTSLSSSLDAFEINQITPTTQGEVGLAACIIAYIRIVNNVVENENIMCGELLSTQLVQNKAGTVFGTTFDFEVFADNTNQATAGGFSLQAVQTPCQPAVCAEDRV